MQKNKNKVDEKIVEEFIKTVLKVEQENLYIKKHGMKDKIISEVKKRIR